MFWKLLFVCWEHTKVIAGAFIWQEENRGKTQPQEELKLASNIPVAMWVCVKGAKMMQFSSSRQSL